LHFHLVFSTKERVPLISKQWRELHVRATFFVRLPTQNQGLFFVAASH